MTQEINKPLYKRLNEERTQGNLRIDRDHTGGKTPLTLAVGNFNTGLDWEGVASVFKEADAKYTALAVNNLHLLAEALKPLAELDIRGVIGDIVYQRNHSKIYLKDVVAAKEALAKIS